MAWLEQILVGTNCAVKKLINLLMLGLLPQGIPGGRGGQMLLLGAGHISRRRRTAQHHPDGSLR